MIFKENDIVYLKDDLFKKHIIRKRRILKVFSYYYICNTYGLEDKCYEIEDSEIDIQKSLRHKKLERICK